MLFLRNIIREAVATQFGVQGNRSTNWGRSVDSMYFNKEKVLTLCKNYIQRYGYARSGAERSTYAQVVRAITSDPEMKGAEIDTEFCNAFIKSLREPNMKNMSPIIINKASVSLHGQAVKMYHLHAIMAAMEIYLQRASMLKSRPLEKDEELRIFFKLKLKRVIKANKSTAVYVFQDQRGNYFHKKGKVPSILLRVGNGLGKVLATEPYEMRLNDLYSFRGKVVGSFADTSGAIVNYLGSLQNI